MITLRYSDPYTNTVILRIEDELGYKEQFLTREQLEQYIAELERAKEMFQ